MSTAWAVTLTSGDGVAIVDGLLDCVLGELIEFDGGGSGIVMNLNRNDRGRRAPGRRGVGPRERAGARHGARAHGSLRGKTCSGAS